MSKKRIRAWMLCVLMLCSILLMCACKDDDGDITEPSATDVAEASYKVTVVNGVGDPYTERIIVRFVQGDTQIAMIPISAEGVAEKTMPKGDYTVQIMSADPNAVFYYDEDRAKLSADRTELELVLANEMGDRSETVSAVSATTDAELSYEAHYVEAGTTHVTVAPEDRNYFLFVPSVAGTYEFSASGDATVGIYGASVHFIMPNSNYEVVDGKITISVQPSMIGTGDTGTTVFVVGLDVPEGATDCLLNIIRTGDAGWSFTEEPWSNYQPQKEIVPYTLPDGIGLKRFDLTAQTDAYGLVFNEEDGCYHLNAADGPMVFVQLADPMYGISMMGMVGEIVYQDGVLMQTGTAPFRYSYDNGPDDFFKEDYTDAMREYVTARDKTSGVYPLNKDLYYMLPMGIEAMGWCRADTVNYLFRDLDGVNDEICWMFLLMYEDAATSPIDPTEPVAPTEPDGPTEPTVCAHTYQAKTQKDATCTEKGGKVYTCSKCGDSYTEEIGAKGHSYGPDGKCTRCGEKDPNVVIEDNKDAPIEIGGTLRFEAEVKSGHLVYYEIYRVSGTYLTISSADAYVVYNGITYEAKNGVVTVPELQSKGMNEPVKLAIGNKGTKDVAFEVVMAYPAGTQPNPHTLKLGSFTTNVEEGNDQGVYYTYTATKSGVLTISVDSVSSGVEIGISMTNESTYQQVTLEDSGSDSVSITVEAGQTVGIIISTLPDAEHKYPAATIKTTASLA